jgi:hypothetical protein
LEHVKKYTDAIFIGCDGANIVDGNEKLILGMVWTLILEFQLKIKNTNASRDMVTWINTYVPDASVSNLSTDWKDGEILSKLVEQTITKHDLKHLESNQLSVHEKHEPLYKCKKAIVDADKILGIPRLIDPEDLVRGIDEKSMMTYLSYFRDYQVMSKNVEHPRVKLKASMSRKYSTGKVKARNEERHEWLIWLMLILGVLEVIESMF